MGVKNRLRVALASLAIGVASLAAGPAQAVPIFTDGFEVNITGCSTAASNHYCGYGVGSLGGGPWNVTVGSVDILEQVGGLAPYSVTAQQGTRSLDLVGASLGTISKSALPTTIGQLYQVTFFYSREPDRAGVGSNSPIPSNFTVAATGTSAQLFSFSGNPTPADMGWIQGFYNFTATTASTTLTFAATNMASFGGAILDNVSVSAVPEPAEWAMMLSGIGLVGWVARRRRNRLASAA